MSPPSILLHRGTVLTHVHHNGKDQVTKREDTDVLIEGNIIRKIAPRILDSLGPLNANSGIEIIDCTGKIISPGFVDTHHHLWQTQLKGRHAEQNLLGLMSSGNMACYSFEPEDIYWGQLAGCLEGLDAGTTTVLDHAHGCYTAEHAEQALDATEASGLRVVYAYTVPILISKWTMDECIPNLDALPAWALNQLEDWARRQPFGDGRVHIGLGFDSFFLPKDIIVGLFKRFREAGVKVITSHVSKNSVFGQHSTIQLLKEYGLLGQDIVLSHANNIDSSEKKILSENKIYISSTPDLEVQAGMGWPTTLADNDIKYGSVGVDCHSNNNASIPSQGRMLLQMTRQKRNIELLETKRYPATLRSSSEEVFNLCTIAGARALGMQDEIGSLEEGKRADILVFDSGKNTSPSMLCAGVFDPVTAIVRHSDTRDIEMVMVDGIIRKRDGKLASVETGHGGGKITWKEIADQVLRSQRNIQTRIEQLDVSRGEDLLVAMLQIDRSKFEESK